MIQSAPHPRSLVLTLLWLTLGSLFVLLVSFLVVKAPFAGFAIAYVVCFLALAWQLPVLALTLIFILAPFQSDVGGGGFARMGISEVNLALTAFVFLFQNMVRKRPLLMGPLTYPILIYLFISVVVTIPNWKGEVSLLSNLQMVLYFVVAVAVFASFPPRLDYLPRILYASVFVGIFIAIAGAATNYSFLGMNKNGLGASLSVITVICFELWLAAKTRRSKTFLAVALAIMSASLLFSLSRGAWLGAMVGVMVILGLRRQFQVLIKASLILVPVIAVCWSLLPQESREYATGFEKDRWNIRLRYESIDFAKEQWRSSPIYGVGVGLRKQYDATNVALLTLAETGILGLAAFAWIHIAIFFWIWRFQKYLPRGSPLYSLLALAAALVANKLAHGMVDHYWSRGSIMMAWATVGMAMGLFYQYSNRILIPKERKEA